ncbi:hypothetical protein AX760_12660 [Pararhizobium antarcticum]|uniref:Microcystin LR degradation protein MlrC C-terminal domain-containing protein n=1 Tax=Pararhizobium antarcticum TaxID=1798805 RepID=A0A657LWU0_9HYPH|nr:hypothetical protein AX761_19130 [Rhizobium sp. 58]OJF99590.1 hypothetical protein AX760_12660 [Pararhizobium antarcticum]
MRLFTAVLATETNTFSPICIDRLAFEESLYAPPVRLVRDAQMQFGKSRVPFGDAAHIRLGGIDIILNSTRAQGFDPSLFSTLGIDPLSRKILVIKSTNHFHAAFSKIAARPKISGRGSPIRMGRAFPDCHQRPAEKTKNGRETRPSCLV